MSQKIVIPLNDKNRPGIDDLLDTARQLLGAFTVFEAYIMTTDDPGMIALGKALAAKSGVTTEGIKLAPTQRAPRKPRKAEMTGGKNDIDLTR